MGEYANTYAVLVGPVGDKPMVLFATTDNEDKAATMVDTLVANGRYGWAGYYRLMCEYES